MRGASVGRLVQVTVVAACGCEWVITCAVETGLWMGFAGCCAVERWTELEGWGGTRTRVFEAGLVEEWSL